MIVETSGAPPPRSQLNHAQVSKHCRLETYKYIIFLSIFQVKDGLILFCQNSKALEKKRKLILIVEPSGASLPRFRLSYAQFSRK